MKKISAKTIAQRIKAKKEREWGRITIQIPKDLFDRFDSKCEKLNVKKTQVLSELIEAFVEN